jgi:hypothetical protein
MPKFPACTWKRNSNEEEEGEEEEEEEESSWTTEAKVVLQRKLRRGRLRCTRRFTMLSL